MNLLVSPTLFSFNIFFCLSCFSSLDPYVDSHLSWFCFSMVGVERIGWAYLKVQLYVTESKKSKKGKLECLLFTFYCHSLLLVTKKAVDNYMLWYHDGPTHLQTFKAGFAAEWSLAWLYLADRHIVYATQVHGVY